jgi:hypothetical protein
MQAILALFAVSAKLIGRVLTWRYSKAAWENSGAASPLERLNADPRLRTLYRVGQAHYIIFNGALLFALYFFL